MELHTSLAKYVPSPLTDFFVVIIPLFLMRFGTLGEWIVCLFEAMKVGFSQKNKNSL